LNLVSKVSNLCFWKKKLNLFEFKNAFDLDFKSKDFLFFSSSPNSFGPITLRSPFFFLTTAGLASLSSPANIPSREAIRPSSPSSTSSQHRRHPSKLRAAVVPHAAAPPARPVWQAKTPALLFQKRLSYRLPFLMSSQLQN
jgi:hypothetical protein